MQTKFAFPLVMISALGEHSVANARAKAYEFVMYAGNIQVAIINRIR